MEILDDYYTRKLIKVVIDIQKQMNKIVFYLHSFVVEL